MNDEEESGLFIWFSETTLKSQTELIINKGMTKYRESKAAQTTKTHNRNQNRDFVEFRIKTFFPLHRP